MSDDNNDQQDTTSDEPVASSVAAGQDNAPDRSGDQAAVLRAQAAALSAAHGAREAARASSTDQTAAAQSAARTSSTDQTATPASQRAPARVTIRFTTNNSSNNNQGQRPQQQAPSASGTRSSGSSFRTPPGQVLTLGRVEQNPPGAPLAPTTRVVQVPEGVVQQIRQRSSSQHRGGAAIRVNPQQMRMVVNNNNVNVNMNGGGRPPRMQHVPRVQLPPLLPQPLPHNPPPSTQSDASNDPGDDHDKSEYKCLICFEFLNDAASCGKCSSRFCFNCIRRVAQHPPTPAKCPTCRSEFGVADIQRDFDLQRKMLKAATVPCQYQGCTAQLLLGQVAAHEAVCEHVPVKCRFFAFGCDWKGKRMGLKEHEDTCGLMQVSGLVEQFRQSRADHEHALSHVQTRVAASNAMMELHASLMRRMHKRLFHPGTILDLVYSVTCLPGRYIYEKDLWRALHSCRLNRAFICNCLVFLPMTLWIMRIMATGFREFIQLESILAGDDDGTVFEESVLSIIYTCVIVLLWVLLVVTFVRDGVNSIEWREHTSRYWMFLPYWREVCCASSVAVFWAALQYDGGAIKASIVLLLVCMCSTYLPSFVITMLETVNGVNRTDAPTDLMVSARAVPVILFGMRHAFVAAMIGFMPWLDAVALQALLRRICPTKIEPLCVHDDLFFNNVKLDIIFGYSVGSFCVALYPNDWNHIYRRCAETVGAFILLSVVNHLVNKLMTLGGVVAKSIYNVAKDEVLPNQQGVRIPYNVTGVVCFFSWTCFLGFILLSY